MATIKSFSDLDIWKRARAFSKRIYELTMQGSFSKDFALKDQINKSTGSVMDNIAEGFDRGGNREFIQFLSYAKGSAGESRSQLFRALDHKHIDEALFNELHQEALEIGNMIGGFMSYLQNSEMRGSKFHEPDLVYWSKIEPDLDF
jgi:four helix bundle protein